MPIKIDSSVPKINPDEDLQVTHRLPEGWYDFKVVDANIEQKNSIHRLILTFKVTTGEHAGREVRSYYGIFNNPKARGVFKGTLSTLGFTIDEIKELLTNLELLNVLIDLNVKARVTHTVSGDRVYDNISSTRLADQQYSNGTNILSRYKDQLNVVNKAIDNNVSPFDNLNLGSTIKGY